MSSEHDDIIVIDKEIGNCQITDSSIWHKNGPHKIWKDRKLPGSGNGIEKAMGHDCWSVSVVIGTLGTTPRKLKMYFGNWNQDCWPPENYHYLLFENSPIFSWIVRSLVATMAKEDSFHRLHLYATLNIILIVIVIKK